MTAKQAIVLLAAELPEDIDWDEAEYQLYLRRKAQEGIEAELRGDYVTMEEAEARFAECLRRSTGSSQL